MTATDHEAHVARLVSALGSDLDLDRRGVKVFRSPAEMPGASACDPYPLCAALTLIQTSPPTPAGFVRAVFALTVRAPTREQLRPLVFDSFRAGSPFGAVFDALARCRADLDGAACAEWCQRVCRSSAFAFGRDDREAYHEAVDLVRLTLVPATCFEVL